MTKQNKPRVEESVISDTQKEMLREMLNWEEYCYGYWRFEIKSGNRYLQKDELKKEMRGLMKLGYVECIHGLINDDGEVCGSGFNVVYPKMSEIKKILDL